MAMTADQLPDDPDVLKAMVLARDVENARLIQIIRELQRHRFGRRAESLPEDQLLLGLEEAEQIEAAGEEATERADPRERIERAGKRRANRGALPAHLPRIE
ncbi:transposase, partial [Mesorhizobium sp. M1C.F.Ca.ET.195.01.1.1]|uniref:transposase n=1 Tax=Mesorhizobium sp. M1C.F.Ca.ET.195.01.1.1 TaxID=2563927 RepID=UPI00113CE9C7